MSYCTLFKMQVVYSVCFVITALRSFLYNMQYIYTCATNFLHVNQRWLPF